MAVIGIDLGTSNSLAVVWKGGESVLIPNRFQDYLTPSVVSIDEDGCILVGKIAKERLVSHPEKTAALFKRTMGTGMEYQLDGKWKAASCGKYPDAETAFRLTGQSKLDLF